MVLNKTNKNEWRGLLIADPECPALDFEAESSLNQLQAASVHYRIAIGPHAGRKALTLYSVPPMEEASNIPLLAKVSGFSLHAATVCEAYQRSRLERLCRLWPTTEKKSTKTKLDSVPLSGPNRPSTE